MILAAILCGVAGGAPLRAAESTAVAMGVTEPVVDVTLSAAVAGLISVQRFKEGEFVKRGDVILELDKRLEELEVSRRQLVMDMRKLDLDKTRTLYEKTTGVSEEELEKKAADFRVAEVEHEMAREQLLRRLVVAPFDGIITEQALDVGEATEAYQPLVRLVDPRQCRFECNLEGSHAALLKVNQAVRLQIDTGAALVGVAGKVVFLSPVADKASGLINVKVLFENTEGKIRPGLAGRMLLPSALP